MRVTIKDIAKEAGVSVSTVSYVLNKKGPITKESHIKVLDSVKKLNYIPDAKARSLVSGRTYHIGMLIEKEPSYVFSQPCLLEALYKVSSILSAKDYWLSIGIPQIQDIRNFKEYLTNLNTDGLMWWFPREITDNDIFKVLESKNIPYILLLSSINEEYDCNFIRYDDYKGIKMAVDYLYSLNHRKMLFVDGDSEYRKNSRVDGYLDSIRKYDLKYVKIINAYNYSEESANSKMKAFISEENELPTAIICGNDFMAIGVIKALNSFGIRVPEDISVVGFDDIHLAVDCEPQLTTIKQPINSMVQIACDYLFDIINHKNKNDLFQLRIEPELVIRSSCRRV